MRDLIDMRGVSGALYRFNRVHDGRPLSPMGGNFLYVRETGDTFEVVFVGEAENLLAEARGRWAEATALHGAEQIYTRLNITERVRRDEYVDIAKAGDTPMTPPPLDGEAI